MKLSPPSALLLASLPLASCGFITPQGATHNGRTVAGISRETARTEGLEMRRFKNKAPVYLPANKIWYTRFEERGMLLAAGEQFTVFLDDSTGRTRLHHNAGKRDALSRERLAMLLGNPRAALRSKSDG